MGAKIGVLALQGDVSEHLDAFKNAIRASGSDGAIHAVPVRRRQDIAGLDALAIPGGESTTISRLIDKNDLRTPLIGFDGGIFATCAGMVLMARTVDDPRVRPLGLMDFSVRRNAFGRQRESFEADVEITGLDGPFHAFFIRAPVADHAGPGVCVTGRIDEGIIALEAGRYMALSFHPELGNDPRLHIRFLKNCGLV
ncbi:MAG: pyridoxal 5'-phosphate synthase glutaminase subunit PdxT [Methanomicrobiales archaeon]|nr:pyridoxal 5'-phosphate synthase glutaminase subunit PdxT [Methanomicrobiales archaeon]NYT21656.1 pyridoxal 5'-phosphate synthase glutaminase subunit PdxT [Methanomicrobiales archaeon]